MPVRIDLKDFDKELATYTELSSVALGGRVISVSDEFFAEAYHLLEVEAAPSLKGQYGPNGALYSGWETKRHNPAFDWCIIKLGATGYLHGFDIDTSHFNGNEAPVASVEGCFVEGEVSPAATDPIWVEVLPKQSLGPNSKHLFKLTSSDDIIGKYNYVKLNIFPDGGVARFRVYGIVEPLKAAEDVDKLVDLAHVFAGGRVISVSDQHYGKGANLLLPGRGKDMGDGWETKRSRETGHKDWVVIRLGQPGTLDHIEIDTNHFKGNYPESCEMHACNCSRDIPDIPEETWTKILSRVKLGPHSQQHFTVEAKSMTFTHVRLTIYPDGGVKRVRVIGRRSNLAEANDVKAAGESTKKTDHLRSACPISPQAFSPYGQVLMAWDQEAKPSNIRMTIANQGTAMKFHNLALVESSYPVESEAKTGFSVYRCSSKPKFGDIWKVQVLERHICTNQAFIPTGASVDQRMGAETSRAYLVVVALNGEDDRPDINTLRAFVAPASQGIVYKTGIWHHPILAIENDIDFVCVETQVGDGSKRDCEVVDILETVEVQL